MEKRRPVNPMPRLRPGTVLLIVLLAVPTFAESQEPHHPVAPSDGIRAFDIGAIAATVLVDRTNLGGGEVEIVELHFPPGTPPDGGQHRHGRVEILYILSGVLEHELNGESHRLEPGMAGIVRPGDMVAHRVLSEESVRALVIWAPGGELERFEPRTPGNR